ncbi:MAG: hypothetical protein KAT00_03350 [Planctomycetes bacterium]|nr:hypothetical protein [Planctomycetota bacterium]
MREALSSLAGQLLLDEQGWVKLGTTGGVGVEEEPLLRKDAVLASRYYWQRDSLYGNLVRLIKNYTFGRGIMARANDPDVQIVLDSFLQDDDNELLATAVGQWELSETIQTDGELPLVFFVDNYTGRVKASILDTLEVTEVITHPADRHKPLYYQRTWSPRKWTWAGKSYRVEGQNIDYYPDWKAATNPQARGIVECPSCGVQRFSMECPSCGQSLMEAHIRINSDPTGDLYSTVSTPHTAIYAHLWKVNTRSERGLPPAYASLTWVKTHKGFMQDRATLTLAAATFAFKQKIKGGARQLARMVTQWGNATLGRYGGGGGRERREGGQIMVENEAAELSQFSFDSRSGQAYQDARMFRQLIGSGGGIIEQDLTGDPTIGNLASMTAMAGTQQKNFESWQQFFKSLYLKVFKFVFEMAIKYGRLTRRTKDGELRDLTVKVDFPPITTSDLTQIVGAISQLISAQSQAQQTFVPAKRIASYILQAFGETDVQQVLKELGFDGEPDLEPLPDEIATAVTEAVHLLMERDE